jgi:hypothetical protein
LSLRGAEIVAAFDEWYGKKPRGYKKVERISGGCAEVMALSIFNDIRRMTDNA